MCGIAGIWNTSESRDSVRSSIERMTKSLQHRGPDGGDIYLDENIALGHRRLSIISPDNTSNQPMKRNSLIIVYNGELYNYREERQRLIKSGVNFKTQSDTEVILALYEIEGINFLNRLNGIFSFAIYDQNKKSLFCARDHFGVKPFLYSQKQNGIIFASELKSIIASGLVSKKLNYVAIKNLLEKGSIAQPLTMLEEVKSLLPGHYMLCEHGKVQISQYYSLPSTIETIAADDNEWEEMIHNALKKSISEQLVSDVPIGAFLSGGIDSGLICAIMAKECSDVKTYSIGFERSHLSDQYDETEDSKTIADYIGTKHKTYKISEEDVKNSLSKIVSSIDHPSIDGLNTYFVSRESAKDVRVALSGTGSDEVFGGYKWFYDMKEFFQHNAYKKFFYNLTNQTPEMYYNSLHRIFKSKEINNILNYDCPSYVADNGNILSKNSVAYTSKMIVSSFLQNQLLPDIDTASMSQGLEVRVPFLSKSLVELALAMPDHLKIGTPNKKAPIGSYLGEGTKKVLVDISERYLPKEILMRPKRGFSLPMKYWIDTVWKEELNDTVSNSSLKSRGIFNEKYITEILRKNTPWTQKWIVINLELWCQNVLDRGISDV